MINLLPDSVKDDYSYGRKNSQIIGWLLTVLFGIVILLVVATVGRLTIQTARNQAVVQKELIEQQLVSSDFKSTNDQYTEFVDGLGNVKKLYQQQILYSRLIRKLGTLLPPGAKLTSISIADKDRAIGLNFDNDADGLGATIQLNLTDQSKQVVDKTNRLFNESLQIKLSGNIETISDTKTVKFYVNADSSNQEQRLINAVRNGGEMAFNGIYDHLESQSYLSDYKMLLEAPELMKTIPQSVNTPQIRSYKVNEDQKSVDFTIRADSISEAKDIEKSILSGTNSLFIETYVFEDFKYANSDNCIDNYIRINTCVTECRDTNGCDSGTKNCISSSRNGCQYVVRAYYDELFASATATKVDESTSKKCNLSSQPCTHVVEAKYSQMFNKVDINRVAACIKNPTSGTTNCPVEMRAEFSQDAKFYLINPSGGLL